MRFRSVGLSVGFAVLIAACVSDSGVGPAARASGPVEHQQLQDPNINPNDTYMILDASSTSTSTVTFQSPGVNPTTGQPMSSAALPSGVDVDFHVEVGYDASGKLRADVTGNWPANTDSTWISVPDAYRFVLSSGQITEYSSVGTVLPGSTLPTDSEPAPMSILAKLGSQLLYGVITTGVIVDSLQANAAPPLGGQGAVRFTSVAAIDANHRSIEMVGPGEGGPAWGRSVKAYHKDETKWVLDSISDDITFSSNSGFAIASRHVLRLRNVRWNVNSAMDSTRGQLLSSGPSPLPMRDAAATIPLESGNGAVAHQIIQRQQCAPGQCGDGGGSGSGGGGGSPPPPGQNIVFQHGLFGSGGVWGRMGGWLSPEFSLGTTLYPSLSATARAQTQTDQLIADVAGTGQTGFLIVGHSMGGLVARRAAQERPDLFTGVLTVGTPHVGAYLALQSKTFITNTLTQLANNLYYGCASPQSDPGCGIASLIFNVGIGALVNYGVDATVPGDVDLEPGSQFTTGLNSVTESFRRVGIQSYAAKRWVLARLFGDYKCFPENPSCGGRAWARHVGSYYTALRALQILTAMLGNATLYQWATFIVTALDNIDRTWDLLTAAGDPQTDGIVQGRSQVYPRATTNFAIPGGDSHDGEPNSDKTRTKIEQAFDQVFLVPRLN